MYVYTSVLCVLTYTDMVNVIVCVRIYIDFVSVILCVPISPDIVSVIPPTMRKQLRCRKVKDRFYPATTSGCLMGASILFISVKLSSCTLFTLIFQKNQFWHNRIGGRKRKCRRDREKEKCEDEIWLWCHFREYSNHTPYSTW